MTIELWKETKWSKMSEEEREQYDKLYELSVEWREGTHDFQKGVHDLEDVDELFVLWEAVIETELKVLKELNRLNEEIS